jgi:hypothetical protein
MILVSSEMFETITTRAYEVAHETIRRMEFDSGPKFTEAMNLIRDRLTEVLVDMYLERLGEAANNRLDRKHKKENEDGS